MGKKKSKHRAQRQIRHRLNDLDEEDFALEEEEPLPLESRRSEQDEDLWSLEDGYDPIDEILRWDSRHLRST